jgi:hypothetical protein
MATLETLERRLQELEDREGIRECLARYTFNADLGHYEEWARNFTPDGVMDTATEHLVGYEQLLGHLQDPSGSQKAIEHRSTHNTVNLFIRVAGDTAWAEGYQLILVKDVDGDERRVYRMGLNHWDFEKIDGRWFIQKRIRREVGQKAGDEDVIKDYLNT